jgi:hypothetical protein
MANNTERSKKFVGRIAQVVYYPNDSKSFNYAHLMYSMPILPTASGQFFFDGTHIHFHDTDQNIEKSILYESIEHVQRTTRGKKVRLHP